MPTISNAVQTAITNAELASDSQVADEIQLIDMITGLRSNLESVSLASATTISGLQDALAVAAQQNTDLAASGSTLQQSLAAAQNALNAAVAEGVIDDATIASINAANETLTASLATSEANATSTAEALASANASNEDLNASLNAAVAALNEISVSLGAGDATTNAVLGE